MRVPDTAQEFIDMTEGNVMIVDPFVGMSTGDKLPGYMGAGGIGAAILAVVLSSHSSLVQGLGLLALALVGMGAAFLNAWVVRERHRTLRVHSASYAPGEGEPDELA